MKLRVFAVGLLVSLSSACDSGSSTTTTKPEPLDELVRYDSYGDMLVAVLDGLRTGDLGIVRAAIATPGQLETMCSGYTAPTGGPYAPENIVAASDYCKQLFADVPQAALDASLASQPYGVNHQPEVDYAFDTHWRDRCPEDFVVYQLTHIFEVDVEGVPRVGFEVDAVYSYQGRFGLMAVPRCRADGE